MNLTTKLKGWLTENFGVSATASDDDCRKAAALALVEDKLSAAKLAELSADDGDSDVDDIVGKAVDKALEPLLKALEQRVQPESKKEDRSAALGTILDSALSNAHRDEPPPKKDSTASRAARLFAGADVRVKSPIERYSSSKGVKCYAMDCKHSHLRGKPAMYAGSPIEDTSQAEKAIIGATFKWLLNQPANMGSGRALPQFKMTEHDEQLVAYAMHELPWSGLVRSRGDATGIDEGGLEIRDRKLMDFERKALLDDSTSGGTEAVPLIFDSAIITTPVLYGELFPLVNVVPVARGRRIQGSTIANVTWTSGVAEGTSITAFNTAAMIGAFSNTMYNAVAAIEIGNDFQEDSPIDIATILVQKAGEEALKWLDNQIANGDGTTEPQGIFNASGTTDIGNPAGGAGAAPQVNDYEALYFGLVKEYRPPSDKGRTVFVGSDTSYRRARAIAVGASDARRVFGMDEASYEIAGLAPFKVQNSISNANCAAVNFAHYRMYRRLGMNVRTETGGKELALKNLSLIVLRMRWAGKIELGGYVAYSDNWQA